MMKSVDIRMEIPLIITKGSIKIIEKKLGQLKNLRKDLKKGKRIFYYKAGGTGYIFPELKYIEREIAKIEKRLPRWKQRLRRVI